MTTRDLLVELRRLASSSDSALLHLASRIESEGIDDTPRRFLLVYPTGTAVKIGGDIDGIIKQVSIQAGESVCYEVNWWDGACRCGEWFLPEELTFDPLAKPMRCGFHARR
jgi:hypothetical protein